MQFKSIESICYNTRHMTNGFQNNAIFWVEVDRIKPNPFQPRKEFNEENLKSLAESIKQYGVLQPLVVSKKEEETEDGLKVYYELIAGERRLRAAKLAKLAQVPVLIRDKEDSDREKLELAIIENLQREDLNPIDKALAFKQLHEKFGMTHAQIAKQMGKSREYVSNALRLLLLPEDIQRAIANGIISEGHARPLLMLADKPEEQNVLFKEITLKKLTVREAEHIARSVATDKVRKNHIPPEIRKIEREMMENLGTRVRIEQKDENAGRIHIDFGTKEDLKHILNLIKKHKEHALAKFTPSQNAPKFAETQAPDNAEVGKLASALGAYADVTPANESTEEIKSDKTVPDEFTDTTNSTRAQDSNQIFNSQQGQDTDAHERLDATLNDADSMSLNSNLATSETVENSTPSESLSAPVNKFENYDHGAGNDEHEANTSTETIVPDKGQTNSQESFVSGGDNMVPKEKYEEFKAEVPSLTQINSDTNPKYQDFNTSNIQQETQSTEMQSPASKVNATGAKTEITHDDEDEDALSAFERKIDQIYQSEQGNASKTATIADEQTVSQITSPMDATSSINPDPVLQSEIEHIMNNTTQDPEDTSGTGVTFNEYKEENDTMPGYDGPSASDNKGDKNGGSDLYSVGL